MDESHFVLKDQFNSSILKSFWVASTHSWFCWTTGSWNLQTKAGETAPVERFGCPVPPCLGGLPLQESTVRRDACESWWGGVGAEDGNDGKFGGFDLLRAFFDLFRLFSTFFDLFRPFLKGVAGCPGRSWCAILPIRTGPESRLVKWLRTHKRSRTRGRQTLLGTWEPYGTSRFTNSASTEVARQ